MKCASVCSLENARLRRALLRRVIGGTASEKQQGKHKEQSPRSHEARGSRSIQLESFGLGWPVVGSAPADRTPARQSAFSTPLIKNAQAPTFMAVARTEGSSLPVRIMTRVEGETLRSRACT